MNPGVFVLRGKRLVILVMIFILLASVWIFAEDAVGIVLDGRFDDWVDKPFVVDPKHDIKTTWLDFLQVGYFTDNEYLYLQVERLSAQKSEPWHFNVVMLNALKGQPQVYYPFGDQPVYAPQFDIIAYYDDKRSQDGIIVDVIFEGQVLESTLSSDNNAKTIEFRVPLESVGLNGLNKEVEFMLKSDEDEGVIDWVADGRPIIVTTGPTLYELSTIVFFVIVSFAAYKVLRKRKKDVSFR